MNDLAIPRPASQGTVVEQTRAAAEVAAAVSAARSFPRDPKTAVDAMTELCSRLSIAERAFYEVPNRGAGLSVHIARELARIWGNIDHGVRELARNDETGESEMSVWAWDMEQNVRATRSFINPHQRMKGGRRQDLTDLTDIYLANQNTGARAVRESIFQVLPGWFLAEAEARLKSTLANGDGTPLVERVAAAIARFEDAGVTAEQLETRLSKPSAKWGASDLATLQRIYASITIDGIGIPEFFPQKVIQVPVADPAAPVAGEPV